MFQHGSNNPEDYVSCVGHTWIRLHARFSSVCVGSTVGNDIRKINGMLWKKHTHTHTFELAYVIRKYGKYAQRKIWLQNSAHLCACLNVSVCCFFLYNLDQGGTDHLFWFLQETNTKNKAWGCVFTTDGCIFPYCSALWLTLERHSSRTQGVEGCEKALFHYRQLLQAQAGIPSFMNVAKKWKN